MLLEMIAMPRSRRRLAALLLLHVLFSPLFPDLYQNTDGSFAFERPEPDDELQDLGNDPVNLAFPDCSRLLMVPGMDRTRLARIRAIRAKHRSDPLNALQKDAPDLFVMVEPYITFVPRHRTVRLGRNDRTRFDSTALENRSSQSNISALYHAHAVKAALRERPGTGNELLRRSYRFQHGAFDATAGNFRLHRGTLLLRNRARTYCPQSLDTLVSGSIRYPAGPMANGVRLNIMRHRTQSMLACDYDSVATLRGPRATAGYVWSSHTGLGNGLSVFSSATLFTVPPQPAAQSARAVAIGVSYETEERFYLLEGAYSSLDGNGAPAMVLETGNNGPNGEYQCRIFYYGNGFFAPYGHREEGKGAVWTETRGLRIFNALSGKSGVSSRARIEICRQHTLQSGLYLCRTALDSTSQFSFCAQEKFCPKRRCRYTYDYLLEGRGKTFPEILAQDHRVSAIRASSIWETRQSLVFSERYRYGHEKGIYTETGISHARLRTRTNLDLRIGRTDMHDPLSLCYRLRLQIRYGPDSPVSVYTSARINGDRLAHRDFSAETWGFSLALSVFVR